MASSGSFNTSGYSTDYGTACLTFSWSVKTQDPATNKTVINWSLKGAGLDSGHHIKAGGFKVVINGQTVYSKSTDYRIELYTGTVVASGTATISHNANGTQSISASAEAGIYYYAVNCSGSKSWDLPTIPRYANITTFNINKRDETSVAVNLKTDSAIDWVSYSFDNSTWYDLPNTYIIGGLTPNKTYTFYVAVRRADSGLWTYSQGVKQTTYDYPYCTVTPDFTIGDAVTLEFYNPLGRTFNFYVIANGKQINDVWTISGTSYTGINHQNTQKLLYATIPNALNATYAIKTVWGDYTWTRDNKNKFKCKGTETPTFNNFVYVDNNPDTVAITGDNKALIKGYSNLLVSIPSNDGAVANNSANMTRYVFEIDTLSHTETYKADDITVPLGAVYSSGVKRLTVRAYDSRGLANPVSKDITIYDYDKPVINADIKRLNNFEAETTLKISGTFSPLTVNGTAQNNISAVYYRYRETGGTFGKWEQLTATLMSGKFACNDVVLSLDNSKSFEFEILAEDRLDATTLPVHVDVGQAIFFISTNKKACFINGVEVATVNMLYPTGTVSVGESTYPIGSVYCNSTNTNPSEKLGGTWELIDKGFKAGTTETTQDATEYLSTFNIASVRGGNTIRLRINVTTAKDIGETTVNLGTVDLAKHGLIKDSTGFFPYTVYGSVAMSDGANAVILVYFTSNGVIQIADSFTSAGVHTLPSGTPFYINVVLPVTPSQMLDEFCDKFYWKRIA